MKRIKSLNKGGYQVIIFIFFKESRWTDSNRRPADYKSAALPAELHRQSGCKIIIFFKTISFDHFFYKNSMGFHIRMNPEEIFAQRFFVFLPAGNIKFVNLNKENS